MTDITLPSTRYSADMHRKSLDGLVQRYDHEGEPVQYKKAAIDINEPACSSCLRYFGDLGLLEVEKQGWYIPPDPIINFINKIGQAREKAIQGIKEILEDDPVYSEITFHVDDEGIEKDELARKAAGILEINKDEIDRIERAIEVYAVLEVLKTDENDVVTLPDEQDVDDHTKSERDQESEPVGPSNQQPRKSPEVNLEEIQLSPTRGDPENLHEICSILKERGSWTLTELAEETEFSERTLQTHVRYGEELGFIQRAEGKVTPTDAGYDLGFESGLNEKTQQYFRDAVVKFDFYRLLLSRCLKRVDIDAEKPAILSSVCEHELRTHFDFKEKNQDTLKRAINAFLQTIEASGHGEYLVGRGKTETRLELQPEEIGVLRDLIQLEVVEEETPEGDEGDSGSEEGPDGDESIYPALQGPPLRISSFRIQNFRNIRESGDVRLENITTFIGKNESGKTSTLEAIASFDHSAPYLDRDICNDTVTDYEIGAEETADIPVVTLRFEITEEISETFYEEDELDEELPITIEVTKYADGHFENTSDVDISDPAPDIVYYNRYDIISDSLYFDEGEEERNDTFENLLKVGELTEDDIVNSDSWSRHQALEKAENRIEEKLNKAWSQKDVKINLRYEADEKCLYLWLQDELEEERPFTEPSQRSEGFQWFFSFYVNLLAETDADEDGYKVLLLDDPAVHLHPEGKQNWLETLEEIAKHEQVLYTSHSPYLINKRYPSRIRTVEDSNDGTQFNADIFDAKEGTLEPLRNALGINLSSSPFISEGQVLVEGPSEYYILSAVGAFFDLLDRDFFDWSKVSLMPVRGANDTIGKASWLASEDLEYAILLDSDAEGQSVAERINNHHEDIEDHRVLLLNTPSHNENVVIEDLFNPELYVECFNEFYQDFTEELEHDFEPVEIEEVGHNSWKIGAQEHDGSRIDDVLVSELERQHVADELRNDDGDIELLKRQIAEVISEKINNNEVDPDDLQHFNRVMSEIDSKLDL